MILDGIRGIGVDYGTGGIRAVRLRPAAPPEVRTFTGGGAHEAATAWLGAAADDDPETPIVLPSGFGVPLRPVQSAGTRDLLEATLRRGDPAGAGLGAFLEPLRRSRLRAYLIPAVKALPTVPLHRKANRVDMGTADKLCAAGFAIWQAAGGSAARLPAVNMLLLEMGTGFKAWVVVARGRIVDGIGGTAGTPGPAARGALDAELAYLRPPASKRDIYRGGAADLDAAFGGGIGEAALWEGTLREAAMLTRFFGIERIVGSGIRGEEAVARLAAAGYRAETLDAGPALASPGGPGRAAGFEAAVGAALVADGLAGGRAAPLVARLGLREATDRVLDYVWPDGGEAPRPSPTPRAEGRDEAARSGGGPRERSCP